MALSLYRKYRPQKFQELCGQNHIKTTLMNEIRQEKVVHAYLFSGPRGTGKTTTARLLAKAVNCLQRSKNDSEPCGVCESCQEIQEGRSLDVIEIDAASHTGVDNVRENIIQYSRFSPSRRKYKVFIIDEVHMLSLSAFNALLKTLEEPPEHVIFILATTELHKVPQTIISRCQRFDFRRVNAEDLIARLELLADQEGRRVERSVLELIVRQTEGSVRDAEGMLGQLFMLDDKDISFEQAQLVIPSTNFSSVIHFIQLLQERRIQELLDFINKIVYEGVDPDRFFDDLIEGMRRILFFAAGGGGEEHTQYLSSDQEKALARIARRMTLAQTVEIIEVLLKSKEYAKYSPIPQLALELAAAQIIQLSPKTSEENPPSQRRETPVLSSHPQKKNPSPKREEGKKVSLEIVREKWSDVLERVKEYNHTLFSFLRVNKPLAILNDVLQIGVLYEFHRKLIIELKNRRVIEEIIEEIFGCKLKIDCVLIEKKANEIQEEKPTDDGFQLLAREFGGMIIDE